MPANPFVSTEYGLFPSGNIRVTRSDSNHSRSESDIAINPLNPWNVIGTSKKFYEPSKYHFFLGVSYSFDGGQSWLESDLPLNNPNWQGMTDPTITFDSNGNAFILTEPLIYHDGVPHGGDIIGQGMYVYKSTNGGRTWELPIQLSTSLDDDKQWITSDLRDESPHKGNIYCVWGANQNCGFARSLDSGITWKGEGSAIGSSHILDFNVFAPAITTDSKGWIHIFNLTNNGNIITYKRSKDAGESFEERKIIVEGVQGFNVFPKPSPTSSFSVFPNGKFRITTLLSATCGSNQTLIIAWPDTRESNISRIYYRLSYDGGETWEGSNSGLPLITDTAIFGNNHCFMPQLAAQENGKIGCSFYTFGQEHGSTSFVINVYLSASFNNGTDFRYLEKITPFGWNPAVNAPFSHGDVNQHFIGDYFGLDVSNEKFTILWTDTRTGVQELFFDTVLTERTVDNTPQLSASFVSPGVKNDGGGFVIVGGKIIPVPPHSPLIKILEGLSILESSKVFDAKSSKSIRLATLNVMNKEINSMK